MSTAEVKKLSFELNEEMLAMIAQEFDIKKAVDSFALAVKEKGYAMALEDVFTAYGRLLGQRALQLGNEYSDRTYELILEMVDNTGSYKFPLLPQRFLEIAYLSVMDLFAFPVRINSHTCICFEINDCKINKAIQDGCSKEICSEVPCKAICFNLIKTICSYFDFDVNIDATISPSEKNSCLFYVNKS